MFKRIILVAAAFSMLSAPLAQAQGRHDGPRQGQHQVQSKKPNYKGSSRHQIRKPELKRHSWKRGNRVSQWQRQHHVRDYQRYGLKRPLGGQHWVKAGNEYLLINIASGMILGIVAGR